MVTLAPNRRSFRFSLRTMFVVMTATSVLIAFIVWFTFWMLRLWATVDLGIDQKP